MKPLSISVNIDKNNNLDSIKLTYIIQHEEEIEGFHTVDYKRFSEGTCGLRKFESDVNGNPLRSSGVVFDSIKPEFRDNDEMNIFLNGLRGKTLFSATVSKNGKNIGSYSYSNFSKPLNLIEEILSEKIDLTKHFPDLIIAEEKKSSATIIERLK
jgi:hypothetical protein